MAWNHRGSLFWRHLKGLNSFNSNKYSKKTRYFNNFLSLLWYIGVGERMFATSRIYVLALTAAAQNLNTTDVRSVAASAGLVLIVGPWPGVCAFVYCVGVQFIQNNAQGVC
jgi:hypothetical protein